jgi:glucosyl-3-phosphoglycerate synthase
VARHRDARTAAADPAVRLVKSAAQRAWQGGIGTRGAAEGGGRVTELTVRPLLALLWPEVAHVAQPLSGEYAADRALLESLPFETGYGVELGLLLDTLRLHGRTRSAQVDLGLRATRTSRSMHSVGWRPSCCSSSPTGWHVEGRALAPGPVATMTLAAPA